MNKKNAIIKKVVVIIPAYLESENLVPLCNSIKNELPGVSILIVDDSPNLDSVHAVSHAEIEGVSIINRKAKMGRGSAVLFGMREFSNKSFDYLIEMDADFSHDPTELVGLLNAASHNHSDLVIASRYLENSQIKDWPWKRRLFSKFSNILARKTLKIPVADYTNGFRVYSPRSVELILNSCGKSGDGFIALSEILLNLHLNSYTITEVETIFVNRIRGQSSLSKKEIIGAIKGLMMLYRKRLADSK